MRNKGGTRVRTFLGKNLNRFFPNIPFPLCGTKAGELKPIPADYREDKPPALWADRPRGVSGRQGIGRPEARLWRAEGTPTFGIIAKTIFMRIGVHVSIAGKIFESIDRARVLGCETMQIFSRSPRGWAAPHLREQDIQKFRKRREKRGISPLAVHIPYLINLATPDEGLYRRSIDAYIDDIRRADVLGADYFVTHLGSHTGSGEQKGIKRFSGALNEIIKKAHPQSMILLETTAGSGSSLGCTFEQIRDILGNLTGRAKVGVCVDTAHIFEAGYDIKTKQGLEATLGEFDRLIGGGLIKVVHFNDSSTELGSHVDRHAHIGKGAIGLGALGRIINHPKLADAAFIMETPKESDRDDVMNLKTARRLYKGRPR